MLIIRPSFFQGRAMNDIAGRIFLFLLVFSGIPHIGIQCWDNNIDYKTSVLSCSEDKSQSPASRESAQGFFIVHLSGRFKIDLRTITSPDHYLILVTTEDGFRNLNAIEKSCFFKILLINQLSVEGLQRLYFEAFNELASVSFGHLLPVLKVLCAEESSIACVAELRDSLGLEGPGLEVISKFTDKIIMKDCLSKQGIPLPKYTLFKPTEYSKNPERYLDDIIQFLNLPIFAKKIDGTCSDGVAKLHDKNELRNWCEDNLDATNYELDEFIVGTLFHCDSLIDQGEIVNCQICECPYPNALFFKGKPLGSLVLTPESEEFQSIAKVNSDVLRCLSPLPNGMTHMEVFRKKDGEIVFLEIAARPPGAQAPSVYEIYLGFNIHEIHYKIQMNLPYQLQTGRGPYSAFLWFPFKKGTILSLNKLPIQSAYRIKWNAKIGDVVEGSRSVKDRVCEILLWNNNYTQLRKDYDWLANCFDPCCSM